jgi:uncharacterized membrane protein YgcG
LGDRHAEQGSQAGLTGTWYLLSTTLYDRRREAILTRCHLIGAWGDPMDTILLAVIGVVVIFGPVVLALVLWANPDRRPWRHRAENVGDTNQEHARRPSWRAWLYMGGGHGSGGVGGGGDSGGGGGGDSSGGGILG